MCPLCENKICTKDELDYWLKESSYEPDSMPQNIIYKDNINNYLYTSVSDHYYNRDTRTLINYCPICGEKLV